MLPSFFTKLQYVTKIRERKIDMEKRQKRKIEIRKNSVNIQSQNTTSEKQEIEKILTKYVKESSIDKVWKKLIKPKGDQSECENDTYLISTEESELRIINFLFIFAIMVSFIASICTILYFIQFVMRYDQYFTMITPETKAMKKEIVIPSLAMIYDDGILVQVHFDRFLENAEMKEIFQLPSSKYYFAMTYKIFLHIGFSDPTRTIIKYHPDLNDKGHILVKNSGIDPDFDDWKGYYSKQAVQFGSKFWLLGIVCDRTSIS